MLLRDLIRVVLLPTCRLLAPFRDHEPMMAIDCCETDNSNDNNKDIGRSCGTLVVTTLFSLSPAIIGASNAPYPSGARRPPRACGLDHRAEGVQVCRGPP